MTVTVMEKATDGRSVCLYVDVSAYFSLLPALFESEQGFTTED